MNIGARATTTPIRAPSAPGMTAASVGRAASPRPACPDGHAFSAPLRAATPIPTPASAMPRRRGRKSGQADRTTNGEEYACVAMVTKRSSASAGSGAAPWRAKACRPQAPRASAQRGPRPGSRRAPGDGAAERVAACRDVEPRRIVGRVIGVDLAFRDRDAETIRLASAILQKVGFEGERARGHRGEREHHEPHERAGRSEHEPEAAQVQVVTSSCASKFGLCGERVAHLDAHLVEVGVTFEMEREHAVGVAVEVHEALVAACERDKEAVRDDARDVRADAPLLPHRGPARALHVDAQDVAVRDDDAAAHAGEDAAPHEAHDEVVRLVVEGDGHQNRPLRAASRRLSIASASCEPRTTSS